MDDYALGIKGMKQVLDYLEDRATDSTRFVPEAQRTKLLIEAFEARDIERARRLLEQPMEEHYGGTGWQYIERTAKWLIEVGSTPESSGTPSHDP
ncbi:MAG: hypothetical protein QM784_09720 [Polyangiaceae bacterium]